jgi:hypothetical protein
VSDFKLVKNSVREESVVVVSDDVLGMDLGELRAAVRAAEGLNDKSQVRFGEIKTSLVEGEFFAKRITIRERSSS